MKRWIILALSAVIVSTVATVAVSMRGASTAPMDRAYPVGPGGKAASGGGAANAPKAILEGEHVYHFGTMPQRANAKHEWLVRNEGKSDLVLWMISSTCSCTLAKFKNGEKAVVPPGESTSIALEFETRENNGTYEKGAEIGTNDPELPQFALHVKGLVFPAVMTVPAGNQVVFPNISNDLADHTAFVGVFSKDRPETKVLKVLASRPKDLMVDIEPFTDAERKELQIGKGGAKLTVHAKSTLPIGTFKEEIVVTTDHPKQPEIRIAVVGKVSGPINLIPTTLVMHAVESKAGGTGTVILSVRNSRATKFEIVKAPKGLKAEVVPVDNGEKKGRYRLNVTVPPGTLPQDIEDEVVLSTDHPKADRMSVPLSIWIKNAE